MLKSDQPSVYHQIAVEDPDVMLAKANIIAELLDLVKSNKIEFAEARKILFLDENQFYFILKGQFRDVSISALQNYLDTLREHLA